MTPIPAPPIGATTSLSAALVTLILYVLRVCNVEPPPSEAVAAAIVALNYAGHYLHRWSKARREWRGSGPWLPPVARPAAEPKE